MKHVKKDYLTIPNIITSFRLLGAIIILFFKPLTIPFFIVYGMSGFTDAIDGFVARKLNQVTDFGSKLDSVADLCFYSALAIKIMPILIERLPHFIWYIVAVIVILRICIYAYVALTEKQLASNHTYLNKATGLLIYLLPFILITNYTESYCFMIAGVSLVAAIQEFITVLLKKNMRY